MLTLHHNFCPYYSDCVNFNEKNPFDGYFQQMNILSPSSFFGIAFFLFLLFFPLLGHVTLISLLTLTSRLSSCVSSHGLSWISMCKLSCLFALEETLYASLGPPSLAKMNMLMRRGEGEWWWLKAVKYDLSVENHSCQLFPLMGLLLQCFCERFGKFFRTVSSVKVTALFSVGLTHTPSFLPFSRVPSHRVAESRQRKSIFPRLLWNKSSKSKLGSIN